MATPVDAYIRVSRVGDRGGRFISPDLQRESIERVCEREGLTVQKWFEELDASGGDNTRPLWNEALDRVEAGITRGIVCWNLSRFSRSVKDALTAIDRIEGAGGRLYSEDGDLGKLDRGIRLFIAEDERDRARAGFRNAAVRAIERGVYISARIPFGYIRDLETRRLAPDPETAPILVELFERRARGQSWRQLNRWLAEEHGRQIAPQTLRGMIQNPAYLGVARQGDIINEKAHSALVTRRLWDKANKAKGRRPVHTGATKHLLLRGIIRCSNCGHAMLVGNTRGRIIEGNWKNGKREKIPTYVCRNLACDIHAYANAAETDEFVVGMVLGFLSDLDAKVVEETTHPHEIVQAEREYEQAEEALALFKKNRKAILVLGEAEWNNLLEEYVLARNLAQTALQALRNDKKPEFDLIPELWEEWTVESKREFLAQVIEECHVDPAQGMKIPVEDRLNVSLLLEESENITVGSAPEWWEGT
jgi:DNA invertase Pin-like site-specific DNA recombinase